MPKSNILQILSGIGSDNKLSLRRILVQFDLLPKLSGIVPVSWLLDKFKSSKFWLANPGGISPVRSLPDKFK